MPKLDIPDQIYQRLVEAAQKRGVSPEQEVAERLSHVALPDEESEAELMEELQRFRDSLKFEVTDEEIQRSKRQGAA